MTADVVEAFPKSFASILGQTQNGGQSQQPIRTVPLPAGELQRVGCWLAQFHFYAALLPRRGPHIASHSVCLSVRPVLVYIRTVLRAHIQNRKTSVFAYRPASRMYFSARAEGRISYGHLGGRTNFFFFFFFFFLGGGAVVEMQWFNCWKSWRTLPSPSLSPFLLLPFPSPATNRPHRESGGAL